MTFSNKPLDEITEADLRDLASQHSLDLKKLDFRPALPGRSKAEEREFLHDVASFANAAGGQLIYGIEAERKEGRLVGLQADNAQLERTRLEKLILDGVEPPLRGLRIHDLALADSRYALILRIPQSWAGPHWVTYGDSYKFYSRTSTGKYLLDYRGLREGFAHCEDRVERLRQFRWERLGKIIAGETTVTLHNAPKTILHVFPLSPSDPSNRISLTSLNNQRFSPRPFSYGSMGLKYNFDGIYTYSGKDRDWKTEGYFQVFRNGYVEVVGTNLTSIEKHQGHEKQGYIPISYFEEQIINVLSDVKKLYELLNIEFPLLFMLSVLGVKGYILGAGHGLWDRMQIDRDNLIIPEIVIEDVNFIPQVVLQPIFDIIWNAGGYERSENYNKEGVWAQR